MIFPVNPLRLFATLAVIVVTAVPAVASNVSNWDKVIDGPARFKVLPAFGAEAVLDKETGLVWAQASGTGAFDWGSSIKICAGSAIGGRRGWRLPTPSELNSLRLADGSLPVGHPFEVDETSPHWTSMADPDSPSHALSITLSGGIGVASVSKTALHGRLCVRGPGGDDSR